MVLANRQSVAVQLHASRSRHEVASTELDRYRLLVENVQDYAIFPLDNASKYTPEDGKIVIMLAADSGAVRITVREGALFTITLPMDLADA